MDRECYRDIEKIKTIGSTYMAAVGLVPTTSSEVGGAAAAGTCLGFPAFGTLGGFFWCEFQAKKSIAAHLCTVSDFAVNMFDVLDAINYQSYNDFVLRVGEFRDPRRRRRTVAGELGGKRATQKAAPASRKLVRVLGSIVLGILRQEPRSAAA